jgi:hypothetical protein
MQETSSFGGIAIAREQKMLITAIHLSTITSSEAEGFWPSRPAGFPFTT